MKAITVPLSDDFIDNVFKNITVTPPGLHEDPSHRMFRATQDETDAAVEITLAKIRELIKAAVRKGWSMVKDRFEEVKLYIKEKAQDLGEHANAFKDKVMERIRTIFNSFYDMMLSTLNNTVKIGELHYQMEAVEIEHSVKMSGELEVSIESLCKFAAEGEISIKGSYKLVAKPAVQS